MHKHCHCVQNQRHGNTDRRASKGAAIRQARTEREAIATEPNRDSSALWMGQRQRCAGRAKGIGAQGLYPALSRSIKRHLCAVVMAGGQRAASPPARPACWGGASALGAQSRQACRGRSFFKAHMKFSIDWPPGFVSSIVVDPKTKRFETEYARAQRCRDGGGWDRNVVIQPGNLKYLAAGPVKMMRKP